MQNHRNKRVTTLAEDFKKIGIVMNDGAVSDMDRFSRTGLTESVPGLPGIATEGVTAVRTKRMSSADRAASRMARRKNKAKINRSNRMKRRKSAYKMKMKRVKAQKKGRVGKGRVRLMVQGLEKRANLLESFKMTAAEARSVSREAMAEQFRKVGQGFGMLARRFAVCEHLLEMINIPIEHPGSEYGLENDDTNAKDGDKTGDAIDTAADAPKGNVNPAEVQAKDPKIPVQEDDLDLDGVYADDMGGEGEEGDDDTDFDAGLDAGWEDCDDDEEETDELGDDFDFDSEDEADVAMESMLPMDFEMNTLRLQAEDCARAVLEGSMSPVIASGVLSDMANHLGASMAMYTSLAKDLEGYGYLGVGHPEDNGVSPTAAGAAMPTTTVGDTNLQDVSTTATPKEDPKNDTETPVGDGMPKGDTPIDDKVPEGNAPKTGDVTDTAKGAK